MKPLSIFFVLLVLVIANANAATCTDAVATTLPANSEVVNLFQCNPDQGDAKPVCFVVAKVAEGQYLYQTIEDGIVINSATTKTVQIVGLHAKYSTSTGDSKVTSTFWPNASLLIMDSFVRKGFFSGYVLNKSISYTCK